jgi:hypothetical protein
VHTITNTTSLALALGTGVPGTVALLGCRHQAGSTQISHDQLEKDRSPSKENGPHRVLDDSFSVYTIIDITYQMGV